MERKAIFAGSFNPFTIGHASIVERSLKLFDRIIIVIGINSHKSSSDAEARLIEIKNLYNNEPRVDVLIWNGLMVDLARQHNIGFFVRGLRNSADFEYERNMADVNRKLAGIETIFFSTLPEHTAISSSLIRELRSYKADIAWMLPSDETSSDN